MIYKMLKAESHKDVISLFEEGVDLSNFDVHHHLLWSCYIPKSIHGFIPVVSGHTDTVHKIKPKKFKVVNDVVTNDNINNGLGADCRAGIYIMHKLIKDQQPYIYVICDQEEVGGIGGDAFTKSTVFESILEKASCFIGLDRKGSNDCASYDYDNSEMFELMEEHGGYSYAIGSFTDVMTFSQASDIACCNLSIGYANEHRASESLDILVMEDTLSFLLEYLPQIFWEKQFMAEAPAYKKKYWNQFEPVETGNKKVLCDCCQQHKPLYEVYWGMVCEDCFVDDTIMY